MAPRNLQVCIAPQTNKPSELAITIAALPGTHASPSGWMAADQVAFNLRALGFVCTSQQVAGWLTRMAKTDAPWVERMREPWCWMYRVTRFGKTDIQNKIPMLQPRTPWLPTYRDVAPTTRERRDA